MNRQVDGQQQKEIQSYCEPRLQSDLEGSEPELEAGAEAAALDNSRSLNAPSISLLTEDGGETVLAVDTPTGLPRLPILPVEYDEEEEETPTVILTTWSYNPELGTLTEVMSNSLSGGSATSSNRKSVTFEERISAPELGLCEDKGEYSQQVSSVFVASLLLVCVCCKMTHDA